MPLDVEAVARQRRLSSEHNAGAGRPAIAAGAEPGQFVMVKPTGATDPLLRRPLSVFEILRQGDRVTGLSLLNKRVGVSTARLFDAEPGDRIFCLGPLGRPFTPVDPPAAAWMVAGGVGLAPFALLGRPGAARTATPLLLWRAGPLIFFLDRFERLGVHLVLATEDGSRGVHGRVIAPLERDLPGAGGRAVLYACGPQPMLAAVAQLALATGRPSQVSVERVMGCGLGGCYSCVIPVREPGGGHHYVRSCMAGPVFTAADLVWDHE
jgi:dihydroorotate dehydrogenase electron transfer subunit